MEKLYLNNPYMKEFKADIIDVLTDGNKVSLVLDKTAFYPEGGGQPSDTGNIGNLEVSYVYEKDEVIYHVVDRVPDNLKGVDCSINWERRFDHMQQHCGQHILSAAFHDITGSNTVGFHLGDEYVTIDIDNNTLTDEEISRVEMLANDIVYKNLLVKYHYPGPDELSKFKLRKTPSVHKDIRIVEIDGFDFSPCCGTHPSHTGDIGLIKVRKYEKYKEYIRVEFICGLRALRDYAWKNEFINEMSNLLSSKDSEVLDNFRKSLKELHMASKENRDLKDKVLGYEANELYNDSKLLKGVRVIKKLYTDRDFKEIVSIGGKIAKMDSCIALLGLKSDSARMIFTCSGDVNIKVNELFNEVLPLINGKGGGSPHSAQGGGSDTSNLESALDSAFIILKNRYLK